MSVTVALTTAAVLWGAAAGLLVPRAAHRLSVEPDEPWRAVCPAGHPFTGVAGGWLGTVRCVDCVGAARVAAGRARPSPGPVPPGTRSGPLPPGGRPSTRSGPLPPGTRKGSLPPRTPPGALPRDAPPAAPPDAPCSPPYEKTLRFVLLGGIVCGSLAFATGPRPELAVWLLLAPFALLLAVVDRRVHRLPDVLTLPLAGAAAGLLGVAGLLPGDGGSWFGALLGGTGLGAMYFVLFLINPAGMGFGDVKLALGIGTVLGWYGWSVLFAGAMAGFVLGALYGLGLILTRRGGRRTAIPFGPFMLAGAWAGLLLGGLGAAG
ncbi:prepilin peptidase [Streptomyces candidus]|uniref:Leader peptidase (Prepilin peptidase)/N-methyltransferase n=1 Tax=Streptomyces candidus TaxID=67283 RepID=A0A7X0HCS2_9ACTN|nr:A24 family peptidase [Streptomyces candidus]MBB6435212.1 leader peptidase (prepilin peptidase)/N-methyltransferase [Streptomyces candidus]GHH40442.1 hypothetical protein GCM10018773_21540 [Streptomyces candidus]